METPTPEKVKELASGLFRREAELEVRGVKFRVRRMTLKEELDWYEFRDKIFKDESLDANEKLVKVWEELLQRCVVEPRLFRYTEELPGPVVAFLIDAISELHLWNVDFRGLRRASS
ncbi:MAG: hypothetical protein QXK84_06695 [Nitrososphaerota archaeon]